MSYSPMELAEAFLKTGELDDALDALSQQLKANPDDDAARYLTAQVHLRLATDEHLQQAIATIKAIREQTDEHYHTLSVIAERLGNPDEAIQWMRLAHDANPEDERLIERLVKLLKSANETGEAIELVRQQPRTWRWLQWEADLLMDANNYHLANARYGLVMAQLAQNDTMREDFRDALVARNALARAEAFRHLENYEMAISLVQQAKALITDDVAIDFTLGTLHALNGEIEVGIEKCEHALGAASANTRERLLASLRDDEDLPRDLVDALLN